jgi:hypothetical protein
MMVNFIFFYAFSTITKNIQNIVNTTSYLVMISWESIRLYYQTYSF